MLLFDGRRSRLVRLFDGSRNAINPQAFADLCKNGKKIDLIDVRTPVEYREIHIEIARNVRWTNSMRRR